LGRWWSGRRDHSCLVANQIGCEGWQSINLIFRPAIFNRDVLAVDVACFAEALAERGHHRRVRSWWSVDEEPNHRHRRLLCLRGERPRGCRDGEREYEIPPSKDGHLTLPNGVTRFGMPETIPRRTMYVIHPLPAGKNVG
jgi:hypothetical protein